YPRIVVDLTPRATSVDSRYELAGRRNTAMRKSERRPFGTLPSPARIASPIDPEYERRPTFDRRLSRTLGRRSKKIAQGLMRVAFGALGYLTRSESYQGALMPGDPRVRRILLVRIDLLGDTVLLTAAVRALRRSYPH